MQYGDGVCLCGGDQAHDGCQRDRAAVHGAGVCHSPDVADLSQKAGAGRGVCLRGSLCRDSLLLLYIAGCRSHGGESVRDSLGLAYALVMMQKKFRGADFESSLLVSCALSAAIGIPFYGQESEMSLHIWFFVLLLGVVQFGLSYVFLSRGLDAVSPVTASLTSTIEPILNPILVAVFYGETIGATAVIGALLVVGSATVYNVRQAKNA